MLSDKIPRVTNRQQIFPNQKQSTRLKCYRSEQTFEAGQTIKHNGMPVLEQSVLISPFQLNSYLAKRDRDCLNFYFGYVWVKERCVVFAKK